MNGAVVVEYGYDAWGKPIATTGSMAETLGYDNPFRYRGYVYDEETGLYYLRSRYYDPVWGRFVGADAVLGKMGKMLDHNIFSYCRQNPIAGSDPDGLYDADDPAGYFRERKAARKRKTSTVTRKPDNIWRWYMTREMSDVAMGFAGAGWNYASDWLMHALRGPGEDLHYDYGSGLSKLIANSPDVSDVLGAFKNSAKKSDAVGVRFKNGDLHYAVNNATLFLSKDASGNVSGTLYDFYDYAKDPSYGLAAFLVNKAYGLQQSGYLYNYNVYINVYFN